MLEGLEFLAFRGDVGALLLGRDQRLFLKEILSARRAYQSVDKSHFTPSLARRASRVRLGSPAIAARSSVSWRRWKGTRLLRGGRAWTSPVFWKRRMNCRTHSALVEYLRPSSAILVYD